TLPEHEKDRLTYLMNLSQLLAVAGRLDEAAQVADEGLAGRERFYGVDHPGYAFGLETIAEVALARGDYDEVLKRAKVALEIYDRHGHPKVPHAWSLLFLGGAGAGATWRDLEVSAAMA